VNGRDVVVAEHADLGDVLVVEQTIERTEAQQVALRVADDVIELERRREVAVVAERFGLLADHALDAVGQHLVGLRAA